MKAWQLVLVFTFIYIILVNFASTLDLSSSKSEIPKVILPNSPTQQELSMGDFVYVSSEKSRSYGTIIENGDNTILYAGKVVPIPLQKNNFNFMYLHAPFLCFIFLISLKGGLKK